MHSHAELDSASPSVALDPGPKAGTSTNKFRMISFCHRSIEPRTVPIKFISEILIKNQTTLKKQTREFKTLVFVFDFLKSKLKIT
ncbi:hypothetical protein Megvenef_00750 [Candidatus Megaera venefica]|uniref:Uncharacterized protein n=1 Tax=Candidatus Megaera venefica TaxID=2055910 RepID=A0ABU5NCA4_9RICK|nr:hypothetical protein [Candidatus Megaera venefica]MEA0970781.1 hypothetical protein [Candidatus Megaera venefica]